MAWLAASIDCPLSPAEPCQRPPVSAFLDQLYQSSPLSGLNADYVEAIYERYLVDPTSVDARWRSYFEQ
ncbi:MAG: hypothetical protein KDI37_01610, partial [Xanthomonadales bacterium]|nr:hypothetical protein [Xanthomonadales bacterium]